MRSLLCGLAVLIACKNKEAPPPPPSDVVIVGSGAEPRHVLRYAAPKGTHQALELSVELTVKAGSAGGDVPTLVLALDTSVEAVLPDGSMQLKSTITNAELRDRPNAVAQAAIVAPQLEPLKGVVMTSTLLPDGHIRDVHAELGDKQLATFAQKELDLLTGSMQQVAMPFPPEALGVGAKWRASRTFGQAGMQLTAVSTAEITKLEGNVVSFAATTEIHGADQSVTMQNVQIDMKNITGTGAGQGTVDLATLAMTGEMGYELSADMSGTAMKASQHVTYGPLGQR